MVTTQFTQRYMLALLVVAGLTIFGQVLVHRQLDQQTSDSYVVNYAGRQRYQSQQIVKDALLMTGQAVPNSSLQALAHLQRQVLARWERYHAELMSGHLTDLGLTVSNSARIQTLFRQIDPDFRTIRDQAHRLLDLVSRPVRDKAAEQAIIQTMLAHDTLFLARMDAIVRQYSREATDKVERLRTIENWLLFVTLFVLVLEALLIFMPAVQMIRQAVDQLTAAHQKTERANEALQHTNQSLKLAQQQLMRETALRHKRQLAEQRMRLSAVVQGQEDERRRLSRELHDGIGQMLTGAKLLSENIRSVDQLKPVDQANFGKLKTLLIRIIQETRHASNNLMPPVLSDFGLLAALRQLTESQREQTGTNVVFQSKLVDVRHGDVRFNPAVEIGLYRIAQEAVNNAAKHAGASRVTISLNRRADQLQLSISDDGCGFHYPPPVSTSRSQGLHNMRERSQLLDGTFRLVTQPHAGTIIQVSIPVSVANHAAMHSISSIY